MTDIIRSGLLLSYLACAIASAQTAPAVTGNGQVPVEAFVTRTKFSMPRISPDGKLISFQSVQRRNNKNVLGLTVLSLPDMKPLGNLDFPGKTIPADVHWVSNTRILIRLGYQASEHEAPFPT